MAALCDALQPEKEAGGCRTNQQTKKHFLFPSQQSSHSWFPSCTGVSTCCLIRPPLRLDSFNSNQSGGLISQNDWEHLWGSSQVSRVILLQTDLLEALFKARQTRSLSFLLVKTSLCLCCSDTNEGKIRNSLCLWIWSEEKLKSPSGGRISSQ